MTKKILIGVVLIGLILLFAWIGKDTEPDNIQPKEEQKEEPKEYNLSLIMAGDALIHESVYKDAKVSKDNYDFSKMFTLITPIINDYDLAFYNQETIIGGKDLGLSTYPRFNSPEEIGDALTSIGFNLVSLANNHTLDRGEKAIQHSINYWKQKNNVVTAGSYISKEDRDNIVVHEKNGIKYVLLAYTTGTNMIRIPAGKEYLVNLYSEEQVKKDIEKVRDKTDIVMVSMHWGSEYTHNPTKQEQTIANYLAELDVDIVIGHHPHVVQPITFIGDTLVIYSLGNFISAQIGIERLVGMLASVDIVKTVDKGKTTIELKNVQSILTYTYYSKFRNYKVYPFTSLNKNILPNYQSLEKKYSDIVKKYNSDILVNGK